MDSELEAWLIYTVGAESQGQTIICSSRIEAIELALNYLHNDYKDCDYFNKIMFETVKINERIYIIRGISNNVNDSRMFDFRRCAYKVCLIPLVSIPYAE